MFSFTPDPIEIPAGQPVTFRLTSRDVIHGFEVVGTNANAMAVPGYVSQFTVTFDRPGDLHDCLQRVLRHRPSHDGGHADRQVRNG